MRNRIWASLFALVAPLGAWAQSSGMVFYVSNATSYPPPDGSYNDGTFIHGVNKFTCDFLVSLFDPNDDWTAGGVRAVTGAGTRWFYSPDDPNAPHTAPGTTGTNRFTCFMNNPAGQFDGARFSTPTSFTGPMTGGSPGPIFSATEINAAWLESPPISTSLDYMAAVMRLTIDTAGTPFNHVRIGPLTAKFGDSSMPSPFPFAGETTVATIQVATATERNGGTLTYGDFYLYGSTVPEPISTGAAMCAATMALCVCRNSRRR